MRLLESHDGPDARSTLSVLVIDDDPKFRDAIARVVRREGCEPLHARDDVEARHILRVLTADLIVTRDAATVEHVDLHDASVTVIASASNLCASYVRRALRERAQCRDLVKLADRLSQQA